VVIVDHNGGERTLDTVAAVLADGWSASREIVVVDNASTPPIAQAMRARYPDVVVRRSERNLGFAGGCNLGIGDLSEVDLIALVNNDCTVSPLWLDPLVDALAADPRVGAAMPKVVLEGAFVAVRITTVGADGGGFVRVHEAMVSGHDSNVRLRSGFLGPEGVTAHDAGYQRIEPTALLYAPTHEIGSSVLRLVLAAPEPRIVHIDAGGVVHHVNVGPSRVAVDVPLDGPRVELINSTGVVLTSDLRGADRGWLEVDDGSWDEQVEIPAWTGAAVLLRVEHLLDIGLFDEALFMYCEDLELSWRGARRGWRFVCAPSSSVRHVHSATAIEGSRFATYHIERNRLLVLARHAPTGVALRTVLRAVLVLASYARRDLLSTARRGEPRSFVEPQVRLAALAGFVRRLPHVLRTRRADRARLGAPMVLGPAGASRSGSGNTL
jgi:GT2 family glycosyltransferase